ncbi:hypothetical protein [uncultured Pseudoteredinibacter sp.]|uniref:hypothetical protein n=1 Tax=uncultured Pseudoteredinibacter sp. TaxID=1641701 RepID=UPI002608500F|nr:hypothetical protein [uncultured Pseudoteredinibacter sp.]
MNSRYSTSPLISKRDPQAERENLPLLAEQNDSGLHELKNLSVNRGAPSYTTPVFLSRCLRQQRRAPQNLRSHVQRINLCIANRDEPACYGALQDLFIILNRHGLELRQRMLKRAKPLLDSIDYLALSACLDDVAAIDKLPFSEYSLFAKASYGRRVLIQRREQNSEADPMLIYRGHMECGELEDAQKVLQQACLNGAKDIELHKELIELLQALSAEAEIESLANKIIALQPEHDAIAYLWRQQLNLQATTKKVD